MHNFQRDGLRQMQVPKGRVNYEPNSFDQGTPRENPHQGFASVPEELDGTKIRKRSETFSDHYSQARLFFRSMSTPEQNHIISAFAFELAKVETKPIRLRMLGHLANIDADLHEGVSNALGMQELAESILPAMPPRDLEPSPTLSMVHKAPVTLQGRKIGVLITDGFDSTLLMSLQQRAKKEKASVAVIAPKVGGAVDSEGTLFEADSPISGGPSIFYDAVVILASAEGAQDLATQAAAVNWVGDAFAHLKVIGHTPEAQPLLDKAGVLPCEGILPLPAEQALSKYIATAKKGRVWERECALRRPG
ncbi:MAG TPA: hypothetical protein DCP71_14515 [Verrucomicrobiales bacterium]|nr:hypothetical protein [Verrucomicrobiales bacterium]